MTRDFAQLGLTLDKSGVWRCGGRMLNSNLSLSARGPILLDHLTTLIVMDAHGCVMHNGIQETLEIFILGDTGEAVCPQADS